MGKLFHVPFRAIHFYKNIPYLWLGIKSFYLRGKNGWSPYDTWNMDCYLLKILPEMLRHLAKNDNTHPFLTFPITEESIKEDENKWVEILNYMAECFEEADEDRVSNYEKENKIDRYSDDYYNNYSLIQKYRDDKKNEGLELLKKYFWNLWD